MNKSLRNPPSDENEQQYRSVFEAAMDGLIIHELENGRILEANPAACKMHGRTRKGIIGLKLTALVHPDYQQEFSEHIQTFRSNGVFDLRALNLRRNGSTFYADWRGTAFTFQGRSCMLSVVRNASNWIQAEQLLKQRIETHAQEQATLLEISLALASALEFQPDLILDRLREVVEYTRGGLFALEDSTLVSLAMRGTQQLEESLPLRIPIQGTEHLAALYNGHRPICLADLGSDDPQAQFLRSLLTEEAAVLREGMESLMWVPLAVRGHIIGGLVLAEAGKDFFTPHHADLALSVANLATITMINAEVYKRTQVLAALEERQRLARNLHDSANQSLFSAGLIAEVLPRLWEEDQQEARRSLEDLRRLTRGAQAEMRALLAELRPSTLTDSNLDDLLHLLGNALTGRTNIPVVVTTTGEFTLPAEVQVAFYRVCQEALYNVAKHAKASQVEIKLNLEEVVELCIRDDGQGFDPEQIFSGHYGLSMMRERAEGVGAVLSITSQPGEGTEITIRWTKTPSKEVS